MCSPARCKTCGKTTWVGCGRHVDDVMRSVPKKQRCTCAAAERKAESPIMGAISAMFGKRR